MTQRPQLFAEITAFDNPPSTLQSELLPIRYAHYRTPTICNNCGARHTDSVTFLVTAHPKRVDVGRLVRVVEFQMNLPRTVHTIPEQHLPACTECFDRPIDLSHLPPPIEAPAWADAVQRATERAAKEAARNAPKPRTAPTIEDI